MTDLLKSVTGGIARFALSWVLPCAVGVGLFWAVCVPPLADQRAWSLVTGLNGSASRGVGEAVGVAAFASFGIAVLLAYSSQLIYRVLEGYHLPRVLDRYWTGRQRRRYLRNVAVKRRLDSCKGGRQSKRYGLAMEQLGLYPESPERIMPTRLGNALRSLEGYGADRFGLDSQQFWYELVGTADEAVRRESEEARSQVDVFVAAISVAAFLAIACVAVCLQIGIRGAPLALGLASLAFLPIAYWQALRNMKEWTNSVRAMVNLGRRKVAEGIGLEMPWKLDHERDMWHSLSLVLHYRDASAQPWLDVFRRGTPYTDPSEILKNLDGRRLARFGPTADPAGGEP
jgi:hypothetical protein